jgi:uncharacterized protein (DUF433 family)
MTLVIDAEPIPLRRDAGGTVRVGGTRVTLDTVVHAFNEGATAEEIAERFSAVSLEDVYAVILFYLRHRGSVDAYLGQRERDADALQQKVESGTDRKGLRERLLARQAERRAGGNRG